MDPATLAAALAVFQAISGAHQAEMVNNHAILTKQVADMNAEFADLDAYNALQQGLTEEARYQGVIDQTLGAQRVALAANDVDISFGTAAELQEETRVTGYLNLLDIRNHANAVANGFKREASSRRLAGAIGESQAAYQSSAIRTSAIANAASTYATYNTRSKVSEG